MSQTVYIPLIVYGREKYAYNAISCGCFVNKSDTYKALLFGLVKNDFIPFDMFVEQLGDRKLEIEEGELEDDSISNLDENTLTIEQFVEYLLNKVDDNFDNLIKICNLHGDSYYGEGWKIQIDEHILHQ